MRLERSQLVRRSFWGRLGPGARDLWRRRAPFLGDHGEVQRLKGHYLGVWVKRQRGSPWVHPVVGSVTRKGRGFAGRRRLALARGREGTRVLGSTLHDLDDDGRPELLLWYRWVSEPHRAVGSHWIRRLAVVDLQGPRLQGLIALDRGGQAAAHPRCTAELRLADLRCEEKKSLYVTRRCKRACPVDASDPSCASTSWQTVEYRYDAGADRYRSGAVLPRPAATGVDRIRDDRPWLVIAAQVPGGRWNARGRAEKHRAALARRGISARVHPGAAFARLEPGSYLVVAGRHKTQKVARAQRDRLASKGIQASVHQGFSPHSPQ